ncbi:MAG TPA: class I tRNA ligase family protein, partial [Candidatus Ozemobacteraceae bacterium]|nr:class I tRNA ligase family protein [Candidatus Ozemobacteraceae bacterium]
THFLGETIDIHSGGSDLVFPHHESEIAQTEAVTQREPFARCWLHTAMVRYEGEKMSKSLGNLVMVTDLLKTYSADSVRLYLGQHHYRTAWSYREAELVQAEQLAQKLRAAVLASGGAGPQLDASPSEHAFKLALDQDLDTPKALAVLENLADHYDEEIDSLTSTVTALLEPILFLGMALVLGSVILAILLPVLSAAGQIK